MRVCCGLMTLGRLFVRSLLLAAEAKQTELSRRQRIDMMCSAAIAFRLRALLFRVLTCLGLWAGSNLGLYVFAEFGFSCNRRSAYAYQSRPNGV